MNQGNVYKDRVSKKALCFVDIPLVLIFDKQ